MSANISWNSPDIIRDGLVLYLDAGTSNSYNRYSSAGVWKDVNGNNVTGSLINGPVFDSANGGSILFDGVDDYVQLPALGLDYPFNLSMIAMVPSAPVVNGIAVTLSDPTANNKSVGIGLQPESAIAQIRAYYYSPSTGFQTAAQSNPLFDTVYNISANYTTSNTVLYVNGSLINTLNLVQTKQWTETSTSYNIARLNRVGTIYYGGLIFQTLIYNRTLSSSEILQNYNTTKGRFGL